MLGTPEVNIDQKQEIKPANVQTGENLATDVKKMIKIVDNLQSFGLHIYFLELLLLTHLYNSESIDFLTFQIGGYYQIFLRCDICYFIIFTFFFSMVNWILLTSETFRKLTIYKKQFASHRNLVDVYVKKVFLIMKELIQYVMSKISTQKIRAFAKIPRINFGFMAGQQQDGTKA